MNLALASYHVALIAIAAAIFVAAGVSDISRYRIPNYMCALLLGMFPLFVLTAPQGVDWRQSLMIFALVGVLGFGMFMGNLAGAGDIKLLSVASLWAGPHHLAVLLAVTAVTGGAVSLSMMAVAWRRHMASGAAPENDAQNMMRIPVPYGVAIATGGLAVLSLIVQPILMPT